jgi:hypothetical protein
LAINGSFYAPLLSINHSKKPNPALACAVFDNQKGKQEGDEVKRSHRSMIIGGPPNLLFAPRFSQVWREVHDRHGKPAET